MKNSVRHQWLIWPTLGLALIGVVALPQGGLAKDAAHAGSAGTIIVGSAELTRQGVALDAKRPRAARAAPNVETITVGCDAAFTVESTDGGRSWTYTCPTSRVEIDCLKGIADCRLRGATKGDKASAWTR